jgi:hypothetical protein
MLYQDQIVLKAETDLEPGRLVEVTSSGTAQYTSASDTTAIGVTLSRAVAGGSVAIGGRYIRVLNSGSSAIAPGDVVEFAANGSVKKHASGNGVGIAVTAAAQNEYVLIAL